MTRVNDAVRWIDSPPLRFEYKGDTYEISHDASTIFKLDEKGDRIRQDLLTPMLGKIKDKKEGKIFSPTIMKETGRKGYFEVQKYGAETNCALCTAAALITKDIEDPRMRKTATIVNAGLQTKLMNSLGEEAMEEIWAQYKDAHRLDFIKDPDNPRSEWLQWQRDDALAWYAGNEPRLQSRCKEVTNANYQSLADQIIGLAGYVTERLYEEEDESTGEKPVWCVRSYGFPSGDEKTAKSSLPFMRKQPDGTKFAVITDEGLVSYGARLHWTYAEKRGGKITFRDFQMDMEGMPEPSKSTDPLGPKGVRYKNDNILMLVLAFGNNDKLVGGDVLLDDGWYVTSQ